MGKLHVCKSTVVDEIQAFVNSKLLLMYFFNKYIILYNIEGNIQRTDGVL